jgi:septum formation protein
MPNPVILLASNSPRRRQLLTLTGWAFVVGPVDIDETPFAEEAPDRYVMRLSERKARAAAEELRVAHAAGAVGETRVESDVTVIVGADTTVASGREILGKPRDAAEAAAMLRSLRAAPEKTHMVFTALAVYWLETDQLRLDLSATGVRMRGYTDEELDTYVASGDPMDKAGAYAIQHSGFHPVEAISGCYAGVMGFPICHLLRVMRSFGFDSSNDVPVLCQASLGHVCPVFQTILENR